MCFSTNLARSQVNKDVFLLYEIPQIICNEECIHKVITNEA